MTVIKRDGRKVDFDRNKIIKAVLAAFNEVNGEITPEARRKATVITNHIESLNKKSMNVEDIQDIIETMLMDGKRKDVARAFVIYRNDRTRVREQNTNLMKSIKEKLTASNVQNQNANIDEKSFGGKVGEASDTVLKQYALDNCMSEMSRNNHLNNEIYIHDLNSYAVGMHNCLSIPFDKLLANGFNTRQTDVRPAQSVNTAFQLVAVIFQLQSLQQFGGVSATHLDWTMIPYIKKSFLKHYIVAYLKQTEEFASLNLLELLFQTYEENGIVRNKFDDWVDEHKQMFFDNTGLNEEDFYIGNNKLNKTLYQSALYDTINETYQAVEGLYHNLNTLQSRSGNQLPFTSINYGTCTEPEGRMVTKALLDVSIKGIGKLHKTSIFPCGIFQCMKGVNRKPGDPNYDLFRLALRSTAQRLYPNYANVDWSGNEGYDKNDPKTYFSTMGCRTANTWDINGFGQLKDGRGNICPVTIIMPTLAMEVKEALKIPDNDDMTQNEKEFNLVSNFMLLLDKKIHEAKDMLLERFEWICSQSPDSAKFMYENGVMEGYIPEEGIVSALKHGTLGVGQIGLAETLQILIGCDHTTDRGMELAKKIEKLFYDRCAEFKKEYKLNFGTYFSPAENLCYTSMQKFKDKYGVIPNVSDKDFFTNSVHVPVWVEITPMQKIDIESQLTGYSRAGCITYVELGGSVKNNIDALETTVNYAMDKDIPYFALNIPNDMCSNCGYTDDIADKCPICGCDEIRRLRRATGYLTGDYKTAFNKGKQQEVEMRVRHKTFK